MEIKKIIDETVNSTIKKLKMAGLMRDGRKSAYEKTEEVLKNYEQLKKSYSEDGTAKKFVDIVDRALTEIQDDLYYEIITMAYFEKKSRETIAEYFDTTPTTISRNKRRLVEKLQYLIFADDTISELWL